MEKTYSELEKKVIEKGYIEFRKDLKEASKPIKEFLKKWKIPYKAPLLKELHLSVPYQRNFEENFYSGISTPSNKGLESLDNIILDMFLTKINDLKEEVDNLPI